MTSRGADSAGIDAIIQEVLDGTASPATRERVMRLRAEDPTVAARFDDLERVFGDLDDLETLPMPRSVAPRAPRRVRRSRRVGRMALPIAASVVALLVGVVIFGPGDEDVRAPATLIAPGSATVPSAWEAKGLRVEFAPGGDDGGLRLILLDDVGSRGVRLTIDTPDWALDTVRSLRGGDAVVGPDAVTWDTRPARTIEAVVRFVPRVESPGPLRVRLEVDGTSTLRTIPETFFESSTNSGSAGRY